MTTFVRFVIACALSTFLQEVWLNGECLLEAFDTVINNLLKSIVAGKAAEFIIKGDINMIKYLKDYLTVTAENETQSKAKVNTVRVN